MPDLSWISELGATSMPLLMGPVLMWTALALTLEAALRLAPAAPASSALAMRRGVLFSLPLALVSPVLAEAVAEPMATVVAARGGVLFQLPELAVGPVVGSTDLTSPAWTVWTMWGLCIMGLMVVSGIGLVRYGVAVRRLAALRRTAVPAPLATQALARDLSAEAGMAHAPPVGIGLEGGAPFTLGARRPLVVVPPDLDGEPLRLALTHELAHVRRRDFAWTLAERAVVALCAAHPLVHVLARGAALNRECLADADVLAGRPGDRRTYADLLLRFAPSPPPALAVGVGGLSPLKHRIAAMSRLPSRSLTRRARLAGRAVAAVIVLVTLGVGLAGASPPAPTTDGTVQIVRPTVTLDGVPSSFGGLVRTGAGGVLGLHVEGYGAVLLSAEPFLGAEPVGSIRGSRLDVAASGHSLRVESEEAVLSSGRTATLFARFDLAPAPQPLTPGFTLRLGASQTAEGMTQTFARQNNRPGLAPSDTTMPELIGGLAALQHAVVYPRIQREAGIEGRSFVQFVVTETGGVRDVTVPRSSGDPALDAAAVAAVEAARFRPGTYEGRPVAVQFVIPITFRLGDGSDANRPPPPPDATMPELVGGLAALQQAVVYPEVQRRAGIQGTTVVQFVVSEVGGVRNAEVVRSSGDEALDAAAVTAVEAVTFRPGMQDGQPTAVQFVVPVRFALPDADGR